jgi:hypothetical protein
MSDSIAEKIRKLLAKANNTACTVEEAQAFNAKAYELMEKHNIDRATIDKEKEAIRTHRELQVVVRPWSSYILHGLCHLYFCKWYYTRCGRTDTVTIVGEESNSAVCHAIAVMVLRAVQQEARATGGGRSFMNGAGSTIYQRCLAMRPKNQIAAPVGSDSRALMVLGDQEAQANAAYIAQLTGGGLRKAKSTGAKARNAGAVAAGAAFGNTLPLRQNLLGRG